MKRVLRSAFVLLCVAAVSHAQTTAAITADDFRQRITIFAHDSMQGRMTGTRGNVRATEYLVRELTRIGAKAAGDNYKFYQDVPIEPVKVDVKNAELATSGVNGLETIHPRLTAHDTQALRDICLRHGLVATGGSDCHGGGRERREPRAAIGKPAHRHGLSALAV